jgi:hypothetical protein
MDIKRRADDELKETLRKYCYLLLAKVRLVRASCTAQK